MLGSELESVLGSELALALVLGSAAVLESASGSELELELE
jgi:hypothetical protein